jgi:hypothetical protein
MLQHHAEILGESPFQVFLHGVVNVFERNFLNGSFDNLERLGNTVILPPKVKTTLT